LNLNTLPHTALRATARALALVSTLALAACGAYQPPDAQPSALEQRQTAVAIAGRPTLAPVELGPATGPAPQPTPNVAQIYALGADDPRALGDPDAPVTIVELTDFECPFCQQFFRETRPQLIAQYVERGLVRIVSRDLPLSEIHPSALASAVAGRCAAAQGAYWPMYERLFASHGQAWGGAPEQDRAQFAAFAAELGLDVAAFRACSDDPAQADAVRAEADAAAQLGINVTPTFFVNGQQLRGAQPLRVFEALIRQEAGE
jgi:protein-disulfide isomerase